MNALRRIGLAALLPATLGLLSGCLERKETIEIDPDGTAHLTVELEGDPGDFAEGDALPEAVYGWNAKDEFQAKQEGKEKQTRIATRTIPVGEALPDAYVPERDPLYAVALRFPTTLQIDPQPEGTYYHFRRTYKAREWARFEVIDERTRSDFQEGRSGQLPLDELTDRDPAELSDEERTRLVRLLIAIETNHREIHLADAVAAVGDRWPQHYGLILRRTMLDYFKNVDVAPVVALLKQPPGIERDEAVNALADQMLAGAHELLIGKALELGCSDESITLAQQAYHQSEQRRKITEDLQDEHWEVRVVLPGKLIAHNGDEVDDDGAVTWSFPADAIKDRDHDLMATSFIPAKR